MADETVVDATTRVKGVLRSEDDIRILGVVEGPVRTAGKLLVARGGLVRGSASGQDVEIHGAVEGDVHAGGQFLLGPTGKVVGDVRAAHIKVEDGGLLQGKVLMEGQPSFQTHERT